MPKLRFRARCVDHYTESLVVMHVYDEPDGYPEAKLYEELSDLDRAWVKDAIRSLQRAGLLKIRRGRLHRTTQLRRLAELHVVGF